MVWVAAWQQKRFAALARHGDLPVLEYNDVAAFDLDLLAVRLEACASCAPSSKAAVDVWQCNALGI
jgi:hypothetical protein